MEKHKKDRIQKELYKLLNITDVKNPDFIRLAEDSLFGFKIVRFEYKDKRRKPRNFYIDIVGYNKIVDLLTVNFEEVKSLDKENAVNLLKKGKL